MTPSIEPLESRDCPSAIFSHGGPVISSIQVSNVYVGGAQNQDALTSVVTGDYMRMLAPYYGTGPGGLAASTMVPNLGPFVSDYSGSLDTLSELQTVLVWEMMTGQVPLPGPDSAYVIHLPAGEHVIDPHGQWDIGLFAGYHSTMFVGGYAVPYAVVLDQGNSDRNGMVFSHEVAEMATDPVVNGITGQQTGYATGWPGWEIGDLTAWEPWTLDGYTVQVLVGPDLQKLDHYP